MRRTSFVFAALAAIAAPTFSFGSVLFEGGEFQVNSYTTSDQWMPVVTAAPDGSFIVAWESDGPDTSSWSVQVKRFDSAGLPIGTEFRANTFTTGAQEYPSISSASDGSFVVVWMSAQQDGGYGDYGGVAGQRFDSSGTPIGTEFVPSTYTTDMQNHPAVSSAPDGSFVVVWYRFGNPAGNGTSIEGQRFDSAGTPVGTEFQANTNTTAGLSRPAVASAPDGSFVVVWHSIGQDGSGYSVHGQRFNNVGAPLGTEFQVNTYTTADQSIPSVSVAADGSFVVAWMSNYQDGAGFGVEGQRFDSAGAPLGTEFQINTYTTSNQDSPRVSSAPDGSFAVVWESFAQDGNMFGIHGQRFDASGAPDGTEFQVNTYTTSQQQRPAVASAPDASFLVVWGNDGLTDGSGRSVRGQRFSIGTTTTSTTTTSTTTTLPSLCGSTPAGGCLGGAKASFQIKDGEDTKDQIKWKLQKGDAFDQLALGTPTTSRAYSLCVYDETGGVPAFVFSLTIDPSVIWDDKNPKGFSYKDSTGAQDGVTKASLKTGAATKSSVSVAAKGVNIPMPAAVSLTEFFNMDTTVTVQLVNDETGTCWTSSFTAAGMKKNEPSQFNAKAP
jgi:hypothetical protein